MKVKVTKLSDNENTFSQRLDELDEMPFAPVIGECLNLYSSKNVRGGIRTSTVRSFTINETGYVVETRNSTYEIVKL